MCVYVCMDTTCVSRYVSVSVCVCTGVWLQSVCLFTRVRVCVSLYTCVCKCVCMRPYYRPRYYMSLHPCVCVWIQGGEDSQDALSCRSFPAKEPIIIGLFCGKCLKLQVIFAKEPLKACFYIHEDKGIACLHRHDV